MKLGHVPALADHQEALETLGFTGENGLEQFLGAAQVVGRELAAYLDVKLDTLIEAVERCASGFGVIARASGS